MTGRFGRDWWPETVARPHLRLALGVVLAPAALTAAVTAAAFITFGLNMPDRESVLFATWQTALVAGLALPVFGLTLGLIAVAGLWAARKRGAAAFGLAGAAAGAAFGVLTGPGFGGPTDPAALVALTVIGAAQLLLVRAIAGIRLRGGPAD